MDTGKYWACVRVPRKTRLAGVHSCGIYKERGLQGVKMFITDKCLGLVDTLGEFYPDARWQRCMVLHFMRNVLGHVPKRIMREIRRRTNVVGSFPDGNSALMLVAARLRYIAGSRWGIKQYLKIDRINEMLKEQSVA